MKNGWTKARKKQQSDRIQRVKPWENSTGPKTFKGKEISKLNATKHGLRSKEYQELFKALKEQSEFIESIK